MSARDFGRASDFALLERDAASFRAEIAAIGRAGVSLLPAVADLFDRVRGSGAELIVVEMPMPSSHRTRFYDTEEWRAYRDAVRRSVAMHGGEYVDASSWIDDSGFEDVFHVNATGARAFSTRLIASAAH
jgi:hypothetical protein